MKVGKVTKVKKIDNPFRIPKPFESKFKTIRITEGSIISVDPDFYIQLDGDYVEEFWAKMDSILSPDKYWCSVFEMFFITKKHLGKVKKWACEHYDVVHLENTQGILETLKNEKTEK